MQTLEIVKLIVADARRGSSGMTIEKLGLVEHILEGTSSYMHDDIIRAAFEEAEHG